jgi:Rho GTPase-activating protein RGD1
VLNPITTSVPSQIQGQPELSQTITSRQGHHGFGSANSQQLPASGQTFGHQMTGQGYGHHQMGSQGYSQGPPLSPSQMLHERSFSQGPLFSQQHNMVSVGGNGPNGANNTSSISTSGPPQLSTLPFQNSLLPSTSLPTVSTSPPQAQSQLLGSPGGLPPLRPVFNMSLEQLFDRDGTAVPMIVYQCILAVDTYGLDTEGIYRISGNSAHINKLKAMFDNGESFDDNRCSGVLKTHRCI